MTIEYFCPVCGTKTNGNTTAGPTGDYYLTCPCCLAGIRFYITLKPSRTLEEADTIFQQTELTDSQRGTKRRFTSQSKK